MTYQECVEYVLSIPLFAKKLGTDNLKQILEHMGHPECAYPVIHVAGTNGKGSTCQFLASLLQQDGFRVGVFTSPHLVRINERIRINDEIISDESFLAAFEETMQFVSNVKKRGIDHPSFFEFVFLMAAHYFQKEKVDYVIFETGMGGRLDATNVVQPVLSVITSVGMDHTQFLGDTLEQIAKEKAGIMKKGVPALYFDRKDCATEVMKGYAQEIGAPLEVVEKKQYKIEKITEKTIDFSFDSGYYKYSSLQIKKTALYQVENAILALKAYELLDIRKNDLNSLGLVKAGLLSMTWPCRMQEIAPHVYIDGAHNEEAIEAFCKTLEELFGDKRKVLLFAVSKDKDYLSMIERLSKIAFEEVVVVRYSGDRAADTSVVEDAFRRFSGSKITTYYDIKDGFLYARDHVGERFLFCVGSLYLAGDLLALGV
ncbi:MAG: folylpolyglutamate synthase/dihydrofolate synthase family protein [Eubacteriales bacterium]|nr:folylpolyglutamate synthase/dihydrofolate synthase family protein [Eubacteriales bacterium]